MRITVYLALGAAACGLLTSCDKDETNQKIEIVIPIPGAPTSSYGAYVVTEGNSYSGIEGGLNVLNFDSGKTDMNIFKTTNGRSLGSTPQCGAAYGSKIYVGTSESNTIEIIDRLTWKSIKQIKVAEVTDQGQPYSMLAYDGKVYISMFGGCLARLDTLTLTIDKTVPVGNNPDQISLYKGKIYVPISDGMNYPNYGKTAVVVDPKTMAVEKTFETGLNPRQFVVADNRLFVLCMGNYGDVPSILYEIKDDRSLEKICEATTVAAFGRDIAIINQPFIASGLPVVEYKLYNPATSTLSDWDIERPDYANAMYYDSQADCMLIASYVMAGQYPSYELPGYVNAYYQGEKKARQKFELGSAGRAWFFVHTK